MSDLPDLRRGVPKAVKEVVLPWMEQDEEKPAVAPTALEGTALRIDIPGKLRQIKQRESGGDPWVGYTPPGEKRVDLSSAPLDETGFPQWEGRQGPAGISHAAGLYQIQPGTWRPIARDLGITDFSEESQERVAAELYKREGEKPWTASTPGGGVARTSSGLPDLRANEDARPTVNEDESSSLGMDVFGKLNMTGRVEAIEERDKTIKALLAGVVRGLPEPFLAAGQGVLPREVMEPVEAKVRELEASVEGLEERVGTYTIGRLAGATVSIMAGARLFGAVAPAVVPALAVNVATKLWHGAGTFGRMGATGATLGALQFYPEGPEAESRMGLEEFAGPRAVDTTIGLGLGLIGGSVLRSLEWGARNISRLADGQSFMKLVQAATNGTGRATGEVQESAVSHYAAVTAQNRANYAVKTAAGRDVTFPSGVGPAGTVDDGFAQAIDGAVQKSKDEGVKSWVEGVARGVKKTLGVTDEEARLAETVTAQQAYVAATEKLVPVSRVSGVTEQEALAAQQKQIAQYRATGGTVPEAPAPFVAQPITSEAYSQARQEINAAIGRAVGSKNAAVETQLKMMLRGIDEVAEGTASAEGVSTAAFVRQREAADKYFRETVKPLRDTFFNGKMYERVVQSPTQGGLTPSMLYDNVVRIVNKDDPALARAVAPLLGERGRQSMVEVLASEAMRAAELRGDTAVIKYVIQHQNVIRELIGRESFAELQGMMKVAGELMAPRKGATGALPRVFDYSHSLAPYLVVSHMLPGSGVAQTMAVLPLTKLGLITISKLRELPVTARLMRQAARMKPGGSELQGLVDRMERVFRRTTGAAVVGERESVAAIGGP